MPSERLVLILPLAVAMAGCASIDPQTGSPDPRFGEASRWNAAAQIIDPDPVYTEDMAQPGSSGAKAAGAAERYRTDRVKVPRVEATSTNTAGGGAGAGAGQGSQPR